MSAGTEHASEVADASVDRLGIGSAEVLDEQPPQEGGEHVGRGLDVGVGREVGAEQQRLVPALAPLGVERRAHLARVGIAEGCLAVHQPEELVVVEEARELEAGLLDDQLLDRCGCGRGPRVAPRRARGTPRGRGRPSS